MHASYSTTIFSLQKDDIDAATTVYGRNEIEKVNVHRFYNADVGSHFFTADEAERVSVDNMSNFNPEVLGLQALPRESEVVEGSI